jgi:AAA domain
MTNDTHYIEIRRFSKSETEAEFKRVADGKPKPEIPRTSEGIDAKIAEKMSATNWTDRSPEVQSLLTLLGYKYNGDRAVMEAEFKKTPLYESWEAEGKWTRLREQELDKAVTFAKEHPLRKGQDEVVSSGLDYIMGDKATPEVLDPMWTDVFAKGKHHHCQGPSSQGKSPVMREITSRVTTHREMPDGSPNGFDGPKVVIIMNLEDDIFDTMVPELMNYKADLSRVAFIRMTEVKKKKRESGEEYKERRQFALGEDIDKLRQMIRELETKFGGGSVGMVIIDPVTSHLGKASMNKEEEVRQVLGPFVDLAREFHLVSVTVGHLNKGDSTDPLKRSMGAAAFCGVARYVWCFGEDKNGNSSYAHLMSPGRGGVDEGSFKYHTEKKDFEFTDKHGTPRKTKVIQVFWDGKSTDGAEDGMEKVSRRHKGRQAQAAEVLHNFLKSGKQTANRCKAFMLEGGYDLDTLNATEVREKAGVKSEQKGNQWWWFLPTHADLFEPTPARQKRAEEIKKDDAPSY